MKSLIIMVALMAASNAMAQAPATTCEANPQFAETLTALKAQASTACSDLPSIQAAFVGLGCAEVQADKFSKDVCPQVATGDQSASAPAVAAPVANTVASNPLSVFFPNAPLYVMKRDISASLRSLIQGSLDRMTAIPGIQEKLKCEDKKFLKDKKNKAIKLACDGVGYSQDAASYSLDGDESQPGIKKLSKESAELLTSLEGQFDLNMAAIGCHRDEAAIKAKREIVARLQGELTSLKQSVSATAPLTKEISEKETLFATAQTEYDAEIAKYPWGCDGKETLYRDALVSALDRLPSEKKVMAEAVLAQARNAEAWGKLNPKERMLLLWTAMSFLDPKALDFVTASPDLNIAGATPVDRATLASNSGAVVVGMGSDGVMNAGVVQKDGKVKNNNGDVSLSEGLVVKLPITIVTGGGSIISNASGTALKATLSYVGGFHLAGGDPAIKFGTFNGVTAAMGYEFILGEKGFIVPFLKGGVGYVTGDRPDRAEDTPADKRVVGLLGGGVKGGMVFGSFSPYLVAEGYGLPGPGFSAGIGSGYKLGDSGLALDASLRWMYIPNTGVPAGLSRTRDLGTVGINGLGLSAGVAF